jgi:ribosome-associated translation inhibitor RaiA
MLQVPLEIAFHNLESSPAVEEEIRARVSELERRYDRLTSCRVRIDRRNKDLTGAIPPVVHIEMGIPGHGDVVVSHSGSPSADSWTSRSKGSTGKERRRTTPKASRSARSPK